MIMPIDIDKKEFTRDKKGYNSREVDEFLDLIIVDYEKCLNDNRSMAHKIKFLEKQLEEAQKSDNAMLDTLETAKRLMADISASAERRAELMIRDAELEAETMVLEAKATVRKLNDELNDLDADEYGLNPDMDRSDIADIDKAFSNAPDPEETQETLVVSQKQKKEKKVPEVKSAPVTDPAHATVADLSDSLKKIAEDKTQQEGTIILK